MTSLRPAHQERVIQEAKELGEKISSLGKFLDGDLFRTINDHEQVRLKAQYIHMTRYLAILNERIRWDFM